MIKWVLCDCTVDHCAGRWLATRCTRISVERDPVCSCQKWSSMQCTMRSHCDQAPGLVRKSGSVVRGRASGKIEARRRVCVHAMQARQRDELISPSCTIQTRYMLLRKEQKHLPKTRCTEHIGLTGLVTFCYAATSSEIVSQGEAREAALVCCEGATWCIHAEK